MAKKKITDSNLFTFSATTIRKKSSRDIKSELLNKNFQQDKIDEFEKSMGYGRGKEAQVIINKKPRLFDPEIEKDRILLTELLNSEKYVILYSKDNWTPDGRYKMFAIYGEIVDEEKSKENE